MQSIELIDQFLSKSANYLKISTNAGVKETSLSLTYKQGCFLRSLLSAENLIYSNAVGMYKKGGSTMSFIINQTHYYLLTPAQWYGDKGFFTLIKAENLNN